MTNHSENTKSATCDNNVLANRLLKFRAWVENQNYMAVQGTPDLETLSSFMHHYSDSKNLMQFTGFKDFEDKEIYEGDILEYVSYQRDENKRKEIVEFDEKCGGWYVNKQADSLADVLFKQHNEDWQIKQNYKPSIKHKVRIIGNIFENPELLQTTS